VIVVFYPVGGLQQMERDSEIKAKKRQQRTRRGWGKRDQTVGNHYHFGESKKALWGRGGGPGGVPVQKKKKNSKETKRGGEGLGGGGGVVVTGRGI